MLTVVSLVALAIGTSEASYRASQTRLDQGDIDSARIWNGISRLVTPWSQKVLRQEAVILSRSKNYHDAIEVWRKVIVNNPNDAAAADELGWAYYIIEENTGAESYLNRAISLAPDYPEAYWHLGSLYYRLKQWDKAETMYAHALDLEPNNPDFLNSQAAVHIQLGKGQDASRLLEEAITIRPVFPKAFTNLAILAFKQGRYTEARQRIEQALEQDSPPSAVHYMSYFWAGQIYEQLGERSKAVDAYRIVIDIVTPESGTDVREAIDNTRLRLKELGEST